MRCSSLRAKIVADIFSIFRGSLGGYKYSAFCFQRQLFVKEIGAVSGRCDWQKYAQMACGGSEIWINVMIFALINRF